MMRGVREVKKFAKEKGWSITKENNKQYFCLCSDCKNK